MILHRSKYKGSNNSKSKTRLGAYGSKKENSQVNRSNHISKDILSEKLEEKFWKVGIYKNLQKLNTILLPPDQER